MIRSRWQRGLCVLSGVLLMASTAWAQGGQGPSIVDPAALERAAAAESVVTQEEAMHGRSFDPEYRAALKGSLSTLSPSALASLPVGDAPRVLGDSAADLVFTPVAPCRIISFVTIPANTTASFFAAGLCGIPFGPAVAVVMNFVAVNPLGAGDLRAFPFGSPVPNASVINYAPFPGLNIANGLIVPICNPNVTACPLDVTIQADVSTATLVVDVYGYFAAPRPLFAVVTATAALSRGSGVSSVARVTPTGRYEVIFTRNVTSCAYVATIGDVSTGTEPAGTIAVAQRSGNVNGVFIETTNLAGADSDRSFYLGVTCPLLPVAGP